MASSTPASNFYGLITKERAEKFALLGQLILNQREAIIVCGAEGIGKTTLLKTFKKQREAIWAICLLEGLETLTVEQIQIQLIATIQQYNPELADRDLQSALSFCEQQQQKAVLIIDNAAHLVAGLIATLTEYALNHPVLRIVFVLTREQLYAKSHSDSVLDACYFLELPPLTKAQLPDFLNDLSIFPKAGNETWEINDNLLNKLYQLTGGIPGKILTDLPLLVAPTQNTFSPSLLKIVLIVGIIVMGIAYFGVEKTSTKTVFHHPYATLVLPLKPVKLAVTQNTQNVVQPNHQTVVFETIKPLLTPAKAAEPLVNKPVMPEDADEQWALQQPSGSYTLQLMALLKRQALESLVKKYSNLQSDLKILKISSQNPEKYILLYGDFVDSKTAIAAVHSLPVEFRQAWPRPIKLLQLEIKNRIHSLPQTTPLPLKQ